MTTNSNEYTATGLRIEGAFENDRNAVNRDLFKAIIREVYGVEDVIIGHHLVYEKEDPQTDEKGHTFNIQVIEEIPSADALIFDHNVAKKLWGEDYLHVLTLLAREPVETRDALLKKFFEGRGSHAVTASYTPLSGHGEDWYSASPPISSESLATLLTEAEHAHAAAVKAGTATDADWPSWYAGYIEEHIKEGA